MNALTAQQLADVIEAAWWPQVDDDLRPPVYPGGGGLARWKLQFLNCGRRALDAGKACRAFGVAGDDLVHTLAVAIFVGFTEDAGEWTASPPWRWKTFDQLPRDDFREIFRVCARAVITFARAARQAAKAAA